MRAQMIECFEPRDFGNEFDDDVKSMNWKSVTWYKVSPTSVICRAIDHNGHDKIGAVSFTSEDLFDTLQACKFSLIEAAIKGVRYDPKRARGTK